MPTRKTYGSFTNRGNAQCNKKSGIDKTFCLAEMNVSSTLFTEL